MTLTTDHPSPTAEGRPRPPRHVVVIGAQKSASSTLARLLGIVPGVEMAPGEFHGFLPHAYAAGAASAVSSLWRDESRPVKAFKCASYLANDSLPEVLDRDLPGCHVVVVLRDPVERAISAWHWYIRTGLIPWMSAERGLRMVLDSQTNTYRLRHAREVLEWGLYARHLQTWIDTFGQSRVHVLLDADLKKDPHRTVTELCESLLLSGPTQTVPVAANPGIYSMARLRWLSLRNRFMWTTDRYGVVVAGRDRLHHKIAYAAVTAVDRWVLARLLPNTKPKLSPFLLRELDGYFRDDVEELERLLDRDLDSWRHHQ